MNPSFSGFERIQITAIGTTVLRAVPAVLHSVTPEVSVGTVVLYDSATAAGTSATNRVYGFTGGTSIAQSFSTILDVQFRNGIVAVSTGTPVALLSVA